MSSFLTKVPLRSGSDTIRAVVSARTSTSRMARVSPRRITALSTDCAFDLRATTPMVPFAGSAAGLVVVSVVAAVVASVAVAAPASGVTAAVRVSSDRGSQPRNSCMVTSVPLAGGGAGPFEPSICCATGAIQAGLPARVLPRNDRSGQGSFAECAAGQHDFKRECRTPPHFIRQRRVPGWPPGTCRGRQRPVSAPQQLPWVHRVHRQVPVQSVRRCADRF